MRELKANELKKVSGGLGWLPVALYFTQSAFEHSDQIINGFKSGYNSVMKKK
ncbi:bacteriocin [Enterobacteriaceae bacterium 4M9]|nr:bacteriocin [Enterobacteriaceae bacterium 4M9]